MSDNNCIHCGLLVRERQEAVTCDLCDRWQHRTCNTGTWTSNRVPKPPRNVFSVENDLLSPFPLIPEVFFNMEEFNTSDHIQPIFDYVRRNWIESSVWKVQNWSVFGQSVRTNNDCEGWHRRLNVRAGVAPPFYSLLKLLHKEAGIVESQVRLVSEMKLRRLQRSSYRHFIHCPFPFNYSIINTFLHKLY